MKIMKNYIACITFCISLILLLACNKEEELPMGKYTGDFYVGNVAETDLIFDIIGSNEKYIILQGVDTEDISILERNGEKVTGTLVHFEFQSFMYADVTGEWRKSGERYIISGIFTTKHKADPDPEVHDYVEGTGTFELKSYAI